MNPYYTDYADYLARFFDGKIQKLSVDLHTNCPHRDGTIGHGGCTYCNNEAFSPDSEKARYDVATQLARGREFFKRKYPNMRYLAYFQSYTSTHGDKEKVLAAFRTALAQDDIVGIVCGTRPDCLPDELIAEIAALQQESGKHIFIELGAETSHNITLDRINRQHTWQQVEDTARRLHAAGLPVGLHLILGLPGETEEMMVQTVQRISELPIDTVKFHQLQILRGTTMALQYQRGQLQDMPVYTAQQYAALCARLIRHLRPTIAIDRFVASAPDALLITPRWGLKNYQFTAILHRELENTKE